MFRMSGMALALALALLIGDPVAAGAAQPTVPADAGIVFGDCDTSEFEFALSTPLQPVGQPIGSRFAVPAAHSFSSIPVSLDALTGEEAAIVILDEFALPIACGPIGGVPAQDGSIVVGLAPVNGAGLTGVAYLLPDGTDVVVSLFTTNLDPDSGANQIQSEIDTASANTGSVPTVDASSGVFTAEERAYANELSVVMETMTDSLDQTNQLLDDPRPDEEQWNFDLILEIVTWGDMQDRLNELTPPPAFIEIHQLTVGALAIYVSAGDDLLEGIQDNDSASIQSGFAKWDIADDLIGDASELVNDLVDERSQ